MQTLIWQKIPPALPMHVLNWLQDKNSFMERLVAYHINNARVNVLQEHWELPHSWESAVLQEKKEIFSREVLIQNDHQFFMFARTILPKVLLDTELFELFHLKNRPLGSALFNYANMQRDDFYFTALIPGMYLHDKTTSATQTNFLELQARYSVFTLNTHSLLLTEVFLPDILNYA